MRLHAADPERAYYSPEYFLIMHEKVLFPLRCIVGKLCERTRVLVYVCVSVCMTTVTFRSSTTTTKGRRRFGVLLCTVRSDPSCPR